MDPSRRPLWTDKQEGAILGYNSKKHRRPSHHPLIATLGERPWVVHSWLRSGNTASARGAENFLEEALALLPSPTAIRYLRADSGFGIESFLSRVEEKGLVYAIAGFAQKRFFATEAAFRLVCVTFNLVSLLQERIGPSYQTLGTLRTQLLACGAMLGSDGKRRVLRLSLAGPWRERFERALAAFFPMREVNCASIATG